MENTVGKEEISPFPSVFSTHLGNSPPFLLNLKLSSAKSFSMESKICRLRIGKGLKFLPRGLPK